MRWQQLFEDLQSQFEAEEMASERAESASRSRAEVGAVHLRERLAGAQGSPLHITVRGAGQVTGTLVDHGVDWFLLDDGQGRELLVALGAVRAVGGLGRRTAPAEPAGAVRSRLDLRWALRGLARDRSAVQVVLDDGGTLTGTLDRVGADFVELAEHPGDAPRRSEAVQGVRAVVIDAVAVVRTGLPGLG
ncbi:hypothetical protein [Blastococcus haudaquaticus]|uniref:Uncharacterized protein n=1 Tax=Blastococcus haudaquaticus TaxID=1938745 RepID=A0A286GF83_9ACTN|nr:hypothetical protein [Blastococcus haudaquaticus]SOD93664.1 hypothetical protein SAMN06272739_0377 [Blastococcus haudaquaticus]